MLTSSSSAFYDPPSTSSTTESFISNTVVPALKNACPGKTIYITEFVSSCSSWFLFSPALVLSFSLATSLIPSCSISLMIL